MGRGRPLSKEAQQSGGFEKVARGVVQTAQFDLLAEMPCGFQNFNQDSDTGRIDVDDFAEVHFETLAIRHAKQSKK